MLRPSLHTLLTHRGLQIVLVVLAAFVALLLCLSGALAVGSTCTTHPAGWHPQKDATGCYYRHEHGSDPTLVKTGYAFRPFGEAALASGTAENHEGFKYFAFSDGHGFRWLFTVHQGTSGQGRVCNRFHEVDLVIVRESDSLLMADLAWLGDFGRAEAFEDKSALTPDTCPSQYQDALSAGSSGSRRIAVSNIANPIKPYEAWRLDTSKTVFGFVNSPAFNTHDYATECPGIECNVVVATGKYGALRSVSMWVPASASGFYLDAARAQATGTFRTNPYGTGGIDTTSPYAPDSVRQYIYPGSWKAGEYGMTGSCVTDANHFGDRVPKEPARSEFVCGSSEQMNMNVDGALSLPN